MKFDVTRDFLTKMFCVYELRNAAGTIQFVGISSFENLLHLKEGRRRPGFKHVFSNNTPMSIQIIRWANSFDEAKSSELAYLRQLDQFPPLCGHIYCEQTGQTYRNVSEALHKLALPSLSALCNHLSGKSGYRLIKDMTFKRGVAPE